jgi:hypothetical protein
MFPVLALDIGSLFAVAFLLISFVGWIMNLISAQNPPPQPNRQPQRPRQRDRKVQTEIETFLQEAMGRRAPPQKKESSEGIEIIEPRPTRRPPPAVPAGGGGVTAAPAAVRESHAPPTAPLVRPGAGIMGRESVVAADMGSNLRSHLQDHMGPRIGEQVDVHLPHTVTASMTSHLGEFRADRQASPPAMVLLTPSKTAQGDAPLVAELRTPAGMRKAIVLQEILSKPRALRRQ